MLPLRLVLDTNIVVSAALKPAGLQRTVLLLALTKPARLYLSPAVFAEYRAVLWRAELQIRKGLRQQLLQLLEKRAHFVVPSGSLQVTSDPADNIFLECADAATCVRGIERPVSDPKRPSACLTQSPHRPEQGSIAGR